MPQQLLLSATWLTFALLISQGIAEDWSERSLGRYPLPPVTGGSESRFQPSPVPAPPQQPPPVSRPSGWPGESVGEYSPWPSPSTPANPPPAPANPTDSPLQPCPGTAILARVGNEAILESEVIAAVNEMLERNKDRIPPEQLESQRLMLIKRQLQNRIETKLVCQDVKRTIPEEGWRQITAQLEKEFEEHEVERMMKQAGLSTRQELENRLRELGSSLERERRTFCERVLAQQWVRQRIKPNEEITYDQMLDYYRRHLEEFTTPARARWEELMVRFSKHPNKAAAYEAIARLGNQVAAGMPFAEVARAASDGPTAAEGGQRQWTSRGSLVCEALDQALFSLPLGVLSPIIEGPTGYHIIRVVEREEARIKPFLEAQVEIREKIVRDRTEKQLREYLAELETRTPVWTVFDGLRTSPRMAAPSQPQRR